MQALPLPAVSQMVAFYASDKDRLSQGDSHGDCKCAWLCVHCARSTVTRTSQDSMYVCISSAFNSCAVTSAASLACCRDGNHVLLPPLTKLQVVCGSKAIIEAREAASLKRSRFPNTAHLQSRFRV